MRIRTIATAALGAVVMYLLDPDRGNGRRIALRNRTAHAARRGWRWMRNATMDGLHRTRGVLVEWRARILWERPSDRVLVERVRSEIGHTIRHPHTVSVTVDGGRIRLRGSVLPDEREAIVAAIKNVPGVLGIEDDLEERGGLEAPLTSTTQSPAASA